MRNICGCGIGSRGVEAPMSQVARGGPPTISILVTFLALSCIGMVAMTAIGCEGMKHPAGFGTLSQYACSVMSKVGAVAICVTFLYLLITHEIE